jgi:hypothetical protein
MVLPPPKSDAAAPARIDAELRSGLHARAAAVPIKVTLLAGEDESGAAAQVPASSEHARGATVVRRTFGDDNDDDSYVSNFLSLGRVRCASLPHRGWYMRTSVEEYERKHA